MNRLTRGRRQLGVSLIEVLVAMLIVSLGVLAMAGLLATASRYGRTSEFRAVATLLANDMADRIRANKAALDDTKGGALTNYDMTGDYSSWADEPGDAAACVTPTECTPSEIAAQDRAAWGQSVYAGLPGGAGFVAVSEAMPGGAAGRNFTADIWVAWLDPDADEGQPAADGECPEAFEGQQPQPRCAFFRVGL
jgi:type IV pilus assembly protein PilV